MKTAFFFVWATKKTAGVRYYHHVCDINLISGDLSSVYELTSDNLANNNLLSSTLLWCTRSRLLIGSWVLFLNSSSSSRMEELEPLFFRSGQYATWMITDLCKMTSIQIFFIELLCLCYVMLCLIQFIVSSVFYFFFFSFCCCIVIE